MKNLTWILCGVMLVGCATARPVEQCPDNSQDISVLQQRLRVAEEEKKQLQERVEQFFQKLDKNRQSFDQGRALLAQQFAEPIIEGDVAIAWNDRGLVVSVGSERLFLSGSDALSDEGKALLDQLGEVLRTRFFEYEVFVEGHTDNQSLAILKWSSDWEFSFARALSVTQYLTQDGRLDVRKFSPVGLGKSRPISSNETKEGRRLNRRIEIIVSPVVSWCPEIAIESKPIPDAVSTGQAEETDTVEGGAS